MGRPFFVVKAKWFAGAESDKLDESKQFYLRLIYEVAMSNNQVLVEGVLKPDGTLELKEIPALPSGPVEVFIRPLQKSNDQETWWEFLERSRAELLAQGFVFRTKEEIDRDQAETDARDNERERSIQRLQTQRE